MDVTLRDGSYLIDYKFTRRDTALIGSALESVGFEWIEIGHGLGLNASSKWPAGASDEEYLETAAETFRQAKWGMFCIPGIAREEDLTLAARFHMSFVRIGTNITEIEKARPFIEQAKSLGMIVSYNAMKSYAVSPREFARAISSVGSWGADIAYLVDSAGGMYPDDISAYLRAVREETDLALGFHGHDNLALAMANTLRALEEGAVLVDSSLQGMGRSAGNAVTEILVAIMLQKGWISGLSLTKVMDIAHGLIEPLMRRRGFDSVAITSGYARFHSSFMPVVRKYARKYGLDTRELIVRLCEEDLVNAPEELLEKLGKELAEKQFRPSFSFRLPDEAAHRSDQDTAEKLTGVLRNLNLYRAKYGKFSVLNIVLSEDAKKETAVSGHIHVTGTHAIGSVVVSDEGHLRSVLAQTDGKCDICLLDDDEREGWQMRSSRIATEAIKTSLLLTYSDSDVWVRAVYGQVLRLCGETLDGRFVSVLGSHAGISLLSERLIKAGAVVSSGPQGREDEKLIVWPAAGEHLDEAFAGSLHTGTYLIDAGIGSLSERVIREAREKGIFTVRVDIWAELSGALGAAHEARRRVEHAFGWGEIDGIAIVSGGAVGSSGDVIVDNINRPSAVIGIADGKGGVLFDYPDEFSKRIKQVELAIHRNQVAFVEDSES